MKHALVVGEVIELGPLVIAIAGADLEPVEAREDVATVAQSLESGGAERKHVPGPVSLHLQIPDDDLVGRPGNRGRPVAVQVPGDDRPRPVDDGPTPQDQALHGADISRKIYMTAVGTLVDGLAFPEAPRWRHK